ncbi:UNVERIFIED_CONTAM: hypothetical protein GTU68_061924 [Idotea baltica]|nr:hypothetical protein [Idotea baltica]
MTVKGKKETKNESANYLHQGIANRSFERKFNLADYVEVSGASLDKGLLTINLLREIPEAMKPKKIAINSDKAPANNAPENYLEEVSTEQVA